VILIAAPAGVEAIIRLVLCALTAYATIKALKDDTSRTGGKSIRAHRLAVLQAILAGLAGGLAVGRWHRPAGALVWLTAPFEPMSIGNGSLSDG
jgi:hypothetical protein